MTHVPRDLDLLERRIMMIIPVLFLSLAGIAGAEEAWANNISLGERGMTWEYTETFTGNASIAYSQSIDMDIGNNDSFVSAWEVLKEDQEKRKKISGSLQEEMNVKIDNSSTGIGIKEVAANLSENLIGPVHSQKTIVNKYRITYSFNESLKNESTIWFSGKAESPVTIMLPENYEIARVTGMENLSQVQNSRVQVKGFFGKKEVVINLIKHETKGEKNESTPTLPKPNISTPGQFPWTRILAAITLIILLAAATIILFLRRKT